jgi:Cu+-exporting ATPase
MHMSSSDISTIQDVQCYHCGEHCVTEIIHFDNRAFCCSGCKLVYELLNENNLCTYYNLNNGPGISPAAEPARYSYLDLPEIAEKLIRFKDGTQAHITFYTPSMHCSSCIWLLENLHRIDPAIRSSSVNFLTKEITVIYNEQDISLSAIATLLGRLGYDPLISLNDVEQKPKPAKDHSAIIKIGIAGFCFGNIMMLSFPEYFSAGDFYDQYNLKPFFGYINLLLSLPVFFYSASTFFTSAWKSIREKHLNIDAPIALAIAVTFSRSAFEIISGTGAGYLDSMSGIVFFMLLGRYFQSVTYETLSFDRDYTSYFPVAVTVTVNGKEENVPVNKLKPGDLMVIRNSELIPVDATLVADHTHIDYSFVTGEATPVRKTQGELIYAGARQIGGAVLLEAVKAVSQSYLTQLWNTDSESIRNRQQQQSFVDKVNRYFTIAVLLTATLSFVIWSFTDLHTAIDAFTAVLIVACPCGLLLASTFCNANMLRLFGKHKLFMKNAAVIEQLAQTDTIVLDKTGTITHGSQITFKGSPQGMEFLPLAAALSAQSSHPLSRKINAQYADTSGQYAVSHFEEIRGMGIKGCVNGKHMILGSEYFVLGRNSTENDGSSKVFLSADGMVYGCFSISNTYREGLEQLIHTLGKDHELVLLSGDHDGEREKLQRIFGNSTLLFNQAPEDKLNYIKHLQQQGKHVLMIGDGLNDAGALLQSDVGFSVSDNTNTFTPACDAILDGSAFRHLRAFLDFARRGKRIIAVTFIISLAYNLTGLFFAVQGMLSPVVAAILMPTSSITIVLLSTLTGSFAARNIFGKSGRKPAVS